MMSGIFVNEYIVDWSIFGKPPLKELARDEDNALDKRKLEFEFELSRIENVTDRLAHDLNRGKQISAAGARYKQQSDRAARSVESRYKQLQVKTSWNNRGDVYIDRNSLDAMRAQGNYYVYEHRNFDREIERAMERELGERGRDREHEREPQVDGSRSLSQEREVNRGAEQFKQGMPGITPDSISSQDRDESDDHGRKRDDEE